MKKDSTAGGPSECNLGETAAILYAGDDESFSGRALLARAIANTPTNERTIRGLA